MVQEQDDNLTELCNHVHGDILTENPAVAQSAFGSHRYMAFRCPVIDCLFACLFVCLFV